MHSLSSSASDDIYMDMTKRTELAKRNKNRDFSNEKKSIASNSMTDKSGTVMAGRLGQRIKENKGQRIS